MSENFFRRHRRGLRTVGVALSVPAWTYIALFGIGSGLVGVIYQGMQHELGFEPASVPRSLLLFAIGVAVYLVGLGILLLEPYAVRGLNRHQLAALLGVGRWPVWRDARWALVVWGGYMVAANIISMLLIWLVPIFNGDQVQQIGFSTAGSGWDKLYAFLTIVVAAPLVEELVFRGYVQGSLRRVMPWWLGALITSGLFGLAHGQWNVGIDTFVLSMAACYAREQTGAIWVGVGIHMLKNLVAYYFLFLAPTWLLKMVGG